MSKPRDDRQEDLFAPPLDEIINLRHPLARRAGSIDWPFLGRRFGAVCCLGPGQPPLPTRRVAGLFILKHLDNLSDEELCERWVENPYFQFFCGEVVFQHECPFDRLTRWRQRLGEDALAALLQESLSAAHRTGALNLKDLERVAVDTTVQEKAIAHPTDARLPHRAIEKRTALAKREGVKLRQSYLRVAKRAAIMVGRYTHAHRFKRARRVLKFLRIRLGRIMRDIRRNIHVDKGYRGHNHPNRFRVWISGQVRRVTKAIRRAMRRRAAIEPVIGHLKSAQRMGRNSLKGRSGDRANAVLAAAGDNFSLLLR